MKLVSSGMLSLLLLLSRLRSSTSVLSDLAMMPAKVLLLELLRYYTERVAVGKSNLTLEDDVW